MECSKGSNYQSLFKQSTTHYFICFVTDTANEMLMFINSAVTLLLPLPKCLKVI